MSLGNPDRPIGGLAVPRPSGIEIRPAGREDAQAVLGLVSSAHDREASVGEAELAGYERLVADPDAMPLLALSEDEAVGMIDFRFRRRLNHATFEGWVAELFVREPDRGRGIGRALLGSAGAEWRLRGGHQVEIELRREEAAAKTVCEAAGFADLGKFFVLEPVKTRRIEPGLGVELRRIVDDDADFEAVTALLAELGRPAPTNERIAALRRTYSAHVARTDTGSMLAMLGGRAVGFVSLEFRDRLGMTTPEAWIPDLIVTEGARGLHIGAALLDAAFVEADRRDASAVNLESGAQRAAAHRLYLAAGMADVGSFLTLTR